MAATAPPALPQEVEAKFMVKDPEWSRQLAVIPELVPGYWLGAATTVPVSDIYLDTPDYQLLRQGYGLRVRTQNGAQRVTLKSLRVSQTKAVFRRLEIEATLASAADRYNLEQWPDPIRPLLIELLHGQGNLRPIAVIRQTRIKRIVRRAAQPGPENAEANENAVAELSLDTVSILAQLEGPVLAESNEVELELAPGGDESELQTLLAALEDQRTGFPSAQSKLEHALTVISQRPAGEQAVSEGIQAAMHMAEACRLIWREQLTTMLLNEAGVRFSDDIEYVHDMRVATRRARAAARLYGNYFEGRLIRRILKSLRRTARLLGAVRDLDVAIAKLESFAAKQSKTARTGLAATLDAWRAARASAHGQLLEWLNSEPYAAFVADFTRFVETSGKGVRKPASKPCQPDAPFQVRHVMPSMVLNRFESVRSFEVMFEQGNTVPITQLHLLRIECKYLRYNLEFVDNLLGPEAQHLIADLRRLQEHLGNLNDAAVSIQMVANEANAAGSPDLVIYLRTQDRAMRKHGALVGDDFRRFVSLANRRRLALAIANI